MFHFKFKITFMDFLLMFHFKFECSILNSKFHFAFFVQLQFIMRYIPLKASKLCTFFDLEEIIGY